MKWTRAITSGAAAARGRRRGARPVAEEARAAAELPRARPRSVPARVHRPGAPAVHRRRQRRGAPVQPRPAAVGVRVVQAREQLLRLRHRQRRRAHRGLPGDQPPDVLRHRAAHAPPRRPGAAASLGEGARWTPAARPAVPAGVPRQHLRDELRLPVGPRHRGDQPRRGAGGLPAQHRGGRPVAVPPQRRRPRLPDRHRLLRVPRQAGPLRPAAAGGPGGARPRSAPWRSSSARAPSPGWAGVLPGAEGHEADRRDPRHRGGRRLHQSVPARRVQRRRQPARLGGAPGRRHRAARGHQVGRRGPDVLAAARRPDGPAGPRRRLRDRRRGRGRHRRRADGLRRLGVTPLPGGVQPRLPGVRRGGPRSTT